MGVVLVMVVLEKVIFQMTPVNWSYCSGLAVGGSMKLKR